MRWYRATHPQSVDKERRRQRARQRALTRLGRMHRAELERLTEEEMTKKTTP